MDIHEKGGNIMEITKIEKAKKKIKVCAYVRISTKEEEQEDSFDTQKSYWEKSLKSDPTFDFVGIFADEGISGRKVAERGGYMRMMELVRLRQIERIYVKSISRFGRNKLEALRAIQEVRDLNAEIIFEKENLRTSDPKCSFTLTVMASFAEAESESISKNIKWSYQKKLERGELQFCRMFGYDIVNKKPVINENEAKWVRFIFEEVVINKKSAYVIAKELNDKEIKTLRGKNFNALTIKSILRNLAYKGDSIRKKNLTVDEKKNIDMNEVQKLYFRKTHPPIVDEKLFNDAQTLMKNMKKPQEVKSISFADGGPLLRKLKCSKCGCAFKGTNDGLWVCQGFDLGCRLTILQEKAIVKMLRKTIDLFNDAIKNSDDSVKLYEKMKKIEERLSTLRLQNLQGKMSDIELDMLSDELNENYEKLLEQFKSVQIRRGTAISASKLQNIDILKEMKTGIVHLDKSIDITLNNGFKAHIKYPKLERENYTWNL